MRNWYDVTTPREEVRLGRSFNPDEFAIALEQVVKPDANTPDDYKEPREFFSRTCFTRALTEHLGTVLRRLDGKTENTAPVLALITQFGGGKTHTLTALYHLTGNREESIQDEGVRELIFHSGVQEIPETRVAVFVGNAWDPEEGAETPWVDIARQLAGDPGVAALGPEARTKAPGTNGLRRLFDAAGGEVLILCDEVLNYLSRHRDGAEAFRDFLGNMVRALTGTTGCAAVVSLPQSKPEMNDWELRWQDLITKEVNRVAKNLISNDEAEISEVIRRRLFEDLGSERTRANTAAQYAEWCFERRAQLPPEWTAVDTSSSEASARELLQERFEACYPFHPATLSVFQRKWQALPLYQQTRGTLAMLAQWVSIIYKEHHQNNRKEPLITMGSSPLEVPEFRSVILTQLGESRLSTAIGSDISDSNSHARALDADTTGPLRDIHRKVGAGILFESSGGQIEKVAHLPELRFALGMPGMDTTSVDTAAVALQSRAYFISRVGSDGYRLYHKATLRKAVNDRRASLDLEAEVKPKLLEVIRREFESGAPLTPQFFPEDSTAVSDSPKLTPIVLGPDVEWTNTAQVRQKLSSWTKKRGESSRLHPAAPIWCLKKPGRELQDKIELWLAWQRIQGEVRSGTLGEHYDRSDYSEIEANARTAKVDAQDEVWASYRYIVFADSSEPDGLRHTDLGAGHTSAGQETLVGRVISALKSNHLLNETVGAGYTDRHWPPALEQSGAWPLKSLRQSFLDGSLTRLLDPDAVLTEKIVEFVRTGDFGLGSGQRPDGTYNRVWFDEQISRDEVQFEPDVYLLKKDKARALRSPQAESTPGGEPAPEPPVEPGEDPPPEPPTASPTEEETHTLRLQGLIPPEVWNRVGTKLIPKLRSASELLLRIDFLATVDANQAQRMESEIRQILRDLAIQDRVHFREPE